MVHVYNCHPFASQHIVQVEQEPGLVCSGGGAVFVVATGGCKVEAYSLDQDGCPLLCRFATMGTPRTIQHSAIGDYLVTIEEKNSATYLRAYTNWRYQAEEKSRVGVRLLGHLLRGASVRGGAQMEIIEIPLSERPVAVACCPVTGDLLVACEKTLVLFALRRQSHHNLLNLQSSCQNTQQSSSQKASANPPSNTNFSVLDFERSVILHIPGIAPQKVALCAGYIAVHAELEVLVVKLKSAPDSQKQEEPEETQQTDQGEAPEDFLVLQRHQELLGDRARDCGVSVTMETTGLEDRGPFTLSYVLYRRFAPDFFQGCSVEETKLHSLQLHPMFTSNQSQRTDGPACVFCFFSLPNTGYLYSLRGGVELLSAYQYPEKVLEAVLTDHLLHVITKSALQCFSVRCAAVAARVEDPYIDTTMRACPPCSLKVCALRMQLFIGLRSMCVHGSHVTLLSAADAEAPEESERGTQRRAIEFKEHTMLTDILLAMGIDPSTTPALESLLTRPFLSKRWASPRPRQPSGAGHGWNLYVVSTVSPITLYHEMVEYSCRYAETHPKGQSCRHLLSEAHLILRASLTRPLPPGKGNPSEPPQVHAVREAQRQAGGDTDVCTDGETGRQQLEEAFRDNCAQLGDCFSRGNQKDCHLALPYYRMSGLSLTDVMSRNHPLPNSPCSYGPGFLFYLKHFLLEEADQILSQDTADEIIHIFSQSEPSQLVSVCASPTMVNASPAVVLERLQHLEQATGMSVPLTITMATMALRLDDLPWYAQLMERHSEMMLVYGFIEEPRLLLHGAIMGPDAHVQPTQLARQLRHNQPGLLAAAMVALHENSKVQLEQADQVFKELGCENGLLVDFWEAVLVASSQEAVIQELLFRLGAVYIDRLTHTSGQPPKTAPKLLKSTEDLINSCCHYGVLYPWLSILTPASTTASRQQEAMQKLQSLLCGPSLSIASIHPLLEQLPETTLWGLSLHVLLNTRRGQYEGCMEKLLDVCPQAIIPYANHHLQDAHMALWWQKLLPELCNRTRAEADNSILLAALKETLVVVATEMSPVEFLELLPDDGTALYFVPHLLACSQRQLLA